MKPRARKNDPFTSWAAAHSITDETITEQRRLIAQTLATHGPCTDQQISMNIMIDLGWRGAMKYSDASLRTRRNEMYRDGQIDFTGDYGLTSRGRKSMMWRLT